jgi:hypothetical protein
MHVDVSRFVRSSVSQDLNNDVVAPRGRPIVLTTPTAI